MALSIQMYSSETWILSKKNWEILAALERRILQRLFGSLQLADHLICNGEKDPAKNYTGYQTAPIDMKLMNSAQRQESLYFFIKAGLDWTGPVVAPFWWSTFAFWFPYFVQYQKL